MFLCFLNSNLVYISSALVTGIIIIKCSLGTRHNNNLGQKFDKDMHACAIKVSQHVLGDVKGVIHTHTRRHKNDIASKIYAYM